MYNTVRSMQAQNAPAPSTSALVHASCLVFLNTNNRKPPHQKSKPLKVNGVMYPKDLLVQGRSASVALVATWLKGQVS